MVGVQGMDRHNTAYRTGGSAGCPYSITPACCGVSSGKEFSEHLLVAKYGPLPLYTPASQRLVVEALVVVGAVVDFQSPIAPWREQIRVPS